MAVTSMIRAKKHVWSIFGASVIAILLVWRYGSVFALTAGTAFKCNPDIHPLVEHGHGTRIPPFSTKSVRIYIGIVTAWWKFSNRLILREAYKHFNLPLNSTDTVSIAFILGKPTNYDPGMTTLLKWESERFSDIHMVDMEENMNDGKSYEYFASLGNMYPATVGHGERPWDYAMKLDDDAFLNIPNLLKKLRPIVPRCNTWFGSGDVEELYMYGPGYLLSWDLVTWLTEHRTELEGFMHLPEDKMMSEMLKWGGKAKESWVTTDNEYMVHPESYSDQDPGPWRRELGPDVILVHDLKSIHLLGDVIQYFLGNEKPIADET